MTSLIQLQAIWNLEYNKLFKDLGFFIKKWRTETKKCGCDAPECKHYQKEKQKEYGSRINALFNSSLTMNALSFVKTIRENRNY